MAINIKDPATDAAARQLASTTGESLTQAIHIAVTDRLAKVQRSSRREQRSQQLAKYIRRGRQRPTLDTRPLDEILGYDAHGAPQ